MLFYRICTEPISTRQATQPTDGLIRQNNRGRNAMPQSPGKLLFILRLHFEHTLPHAAAVKEAASLLLPNPLIQFT